jgi:hypothetical protein
MTEQDVVRLLGTLTDDDRTLLLRVAVVLPGAFEARTVEDVLQPQGVALPTLASLLVRGKRCSLLEGVASSAQYRVSTMLQRVAR